MKCILIFSCLVFTLQVNSIAASRDTLTIISDSSNSKFGIVNTNILTQCDSLGNDLIIADWTVFSIFKIWRTYLWFNLSGIPAHSIVDSAFLSLYADSASASGNPGSPTYGSANASGIFMVTSPWSLNPFSAAPLSWNNQPGVTTYCDTLHESDTTVENYLNVDVTNMIQHMYYSDSNYGFLLRHLQETVYYNSMIFYSPLAPMKHPVLKVIYHSSTGIANINNSCAHVDLYPNPSTRQVSISVTKEEDEQLEIVVLDLYGKIINRYNVNNSVTQYVQNINVEGYNKGIYSVKATSNKGGIITKKLIIE